MSISGCLDCIISKNMNISKSDVNTIIDSESKEKSFREVKKIIEANITQTEEFTKKNVIDKQYAPFVAMLDSLNAVLESVTNPLAFVDAGLDLISGLTSLLGDMVGLIEIGADPVGKLKELTFGDFIKDFEISIELKVPNIDGVSKYAKGLSFGKIGEVPFPEWDGSEAQGKLTDLVMCMFLPLLDPLFDLINEVEENATSQVEGLIESTTKSQVLAATVQATTGTPANAAALAAYSAETVGLIQLINELIALLEKIISLIPPTNFMKDKMKLYFSGISLDKISIPTEGAVTVIDMSTSLVDCLFEEIIDIFV